ncbi:cohesin domain-containing protein [Microbacterium aquimaris]|uniref:Cohesin domain-containing protein n=1 Tax=Microbacterium aquimaris TaxID=459816 RepID=A0ABU5N5F6_9MICO|nr:cohesin domain-containing protein [Microbacterium aquimaris]MDZ8161157.1 cohesin domain-containing protein [Microbacterium aquimaris]
MHATPIRPRKRSRALAAAATALALFSGSIALAPAANAAPPETGTITLDAPSSVEAGQTLEVVAEAPAATDLYAYSLTVDFDPTVVEFDTAATSHPTDGFDSVSEAAGSVEFTHTRLGTSPGLEGETTLVTFTFTALAGGTVEFSLSEATFVSSTDETLELTAAVTASTEVTADVDPTPTPTSSATTDPTADPTSTDEATSTDDETATGDLASTGSDASVWTIVAAFAAALAAFGVVLVLRRRAVNR